MKFLYVLLINLLVLVSRINAWGANGHMLIAQIAQLELQNKYPKVYELANKHVESMGDLSENNNDFASAAAWPDQIRSKGMAFWADWHFYDRPYNPDGLYLMQEEKGSKINSIDCLDKARYQLRVRPDDIDLQKAIFIRFALHVVGDIHQPLHSTTLINETYPTALGDLAGNREYITTIHGDQMKLHSFWDRGGQYLQRPREWSLKAPLSSQNKTMLEDWAADLIQQYPREYYKGQDKNLDVVSWTKESFHLSKDKVYPEMMLTNQLSEEYTSQAQEVCRQRVVLAGYRLVEYLVDIWGEHVGEQSLNDNNSQNIKKFLE